jgi:hypothetical protein
MEGPALTWRLRRISTSLWSTIHATTKSGWLAVNTEISAAKSLNAVARSLRSVARPLSLTEPAQGERRWLDSHHDDSACAK